MKDSKALKVQTSAGLLMVILLSVSLTTGCQTIQYESRFMKKTQAKGISYNVSAAELRLQLDDLAGVFSGSIEQAADQIIAEPADKEIKRHALLWKINAIPTAYRALFQPDPAVALIDTLAFSMQMVTYFERGPGKDDFGQWHLIALDASRRLEKKVMEHVERARTDKNIKPLQDEIQTWVLENPIERDFIYRNSVVPILGSLIGEREMGALEKVGSLALSVEELAYQLIVYMNLLTKQARWQAELVMKGTLDEPGIQDGLVALNDLGSFAKRMTPMVAQAPDLVARERETILEALRQERIEVLANIDRQRIETLVYLTRERIAVTDDLKSERRTVMDILQSEREAILQAIDEQRIATLIEIESAGNLIIENSLKQFEQLIDYFFIRVLQLLVGILLCGVVAAVIVFGLKRKRKTAVGET
jgi:hypothetical protein